MDKSERDKELVELMIKSGMYDSFDEIDNSLNVANETKNVTHSNPQNIQTQKKSILSGPSLGEMGEVGKPFYKKVIIGTIVIVVVFALIGFIASL